MPGLIEELKRRKVFRVLLAYLVASWLLLQVADVLSSILSLPDWAPKLVFFLLAIGIVPALILAWAYELTPQGIQRDHDVRQSGTSAAPSRLRDALLAGGLLVVIGAGAGLYWLAGADERWVDNNSDNRFDNSPLHAAAWRGSAGGGLAAGQAGGRAHRPRPNAACRRRPSPGA